MKLGRILAGIDFGKDTDSILAYTAHFAKISRASVSLLYVLDYLVTPPAYLIQYMEEERKKAEKRFENLKSQLADSDIRAEAEVVVGRLQESFAASIKKTKADMLVLGFVTHALRRSSSEKLIKGQKMPMLVVRGRKSESARLDLLKIKKILCPVDMSAISGNALTIAGQLCAVFSAELSVLYVLPDSLFKKMGMGEEGEKAAQDLYEKTKERLGVFLSEFSLKQTGKIVQGEPHSSIILHAEEDDTDLIIMGARGLGLIQGMLIGSVTDAVLKSSPCPVLVIH